MPLAKSNPLSTKYVLPGRLAWRTLSGPTLDELLSRFIGPLRYRASIVGPHGSGKSTLLAHLAPKIGCVIARASVVSSPSTTGSDGEPRKDRGDGTEPTSSRNESGERQVVWLQLRGRRPSSQLVFRLRNTWAHRSTVLVIDGYEQLSWFARARLLIYTARAGNGLLITSHRPTILPTLIRTEANVAIAQSLLDELLPADTSDRAGLLDAERLGGMLVQHRGNLRELFMELYDKVERPRNKSDS